MMNKHERLYKVLSFNAQSCHNGTMDWNPYLPKWIWDDFDNCKGHWEEGKWLIAEGDLKWCKNGLHLTSHPLRWMVQKGRIFIAEHNGEWIQPETTDKSCFRAVRLIAELGIDSLDLDVKIFKIINSRTDLSSANLSSADLSYADLSSANLSSANLSYADLSSANLSSADLSSADPLEGVSIDNDPKINGYKFDNWRLWKI
jgi:hypothetical protein